MGQRAQLVAIAMVLAVLVAGAARLRQSPTGDDGTATAGPGAAGGVVVAPSPSVDRSRSFVPGPTSGPLAGGAGGLDAGDREPTTSPQSGFRSPITGLPLALTGVILSDNPQIARASIRAEGAELLYAIGDPLPVGDAVFLEEIQADRVVLMNAGHRELLYVRATNTGDSVAQGEGIAQPAASPPAGVRSARAAEVLKMAEAHRRGEFGPPTSLSQLMNVSPVTEYDSLTGYRIAAGRDRAQLEALGLRVGDVIVGVNGTSLTDPALAAELFGALQRGRRASFELLRDGEPVRLAVDLDRGLSR